MKTYNELKKDIIELSKEPNKNYTELLQIYQTLLQKYYSQKNKK
jgi:hypothetical protein